MKILNLYAGIGGNRKLWGDEHEITAIENNLQIAEIYYQNFPNDTLYTDNAHLYLAQYCENFDFIWASPPCQSHTKMVKATRHNASRYPDLSIYQEIIYLQHFFKGKWVVENVKPYYEPLIRPTAEIGRHIFWSNFRIPKIKVKNHKNFINSDSPEAIQSMKDWLGIQFDGNVYYDGNHSPGQILRNCVHPEIGLHILNRAMNIKSQEEQKQQTLF